MWNCWLPDRLLITRWDWADVTETYHQFFTYGELFERFETGQQALHRTHMCFPLFTLNLEPFSNNCLRRKCISMSSNKVKLIWTSSWIAIIPSKREWNLSVQWPVESKFQGLVFLRLRLKQLPPLDINLFDCISCQWYQGCVLFNLADLIWGVKAWWRKRRNEKGGKIVVLHSNF